MKFSTRFKVRAALVLSAAGAIAAFGACGKEGGPVDPPPPPPPPPPLAAPTGLAATTVSATRINLTWTETSTDETGFRVDRCSGPGCTTFAEIGTVAANTVTYADSVGLAANTQYSYRVRAFNATATSDWSAVVNASTAIIPPAGKSFVLVGAGEITSCGPGGRAGATATLIDQVITETPDAIVFTAGNNVNDSTSAKASTAYVDCFDPVWGKFKSRMRAALGQQDYRTVNSTSSMYNYFGEAAGADRTGWYSFDLGTNWHIIVLNTASWQWGTCNLTGAGSNPECAGKPTPMLDWLTNDLNASAGKRCIGVISWERRFYSGTGTTFMNSNMRTISRMLTDARVDFVVSAKDKLYSRFAPQGFEGTADPNGIRQFIVGTGGRSLDGATGLTNPPNMEVRDATTQGVLKLTLSDNAYEWKFMPIAGGTFTDTGKTDCHQ
jgi:acid phosphatase type 7